MSRRYDLHPDQWVSRYTKNELMSLALSFRDMGYTYISHQMFIYPLSTGSFKSSKSFLNKFSMEIKRILKIQKEAKGKICGAHSEIKRMARFMYEMNLDEMPLHISDDSAIPRTVSRWRLKIGK